MGRNKGMGGIYDRSLRGYTGDLPWRAQTRDHNGIQVSRCHPTYKEAEDWKRDQEEQKRNWDNIGYSKQRDLATLRKITVAVLIHEFINRERGRLGLSDVHALMYFCNAGGGITTISLADIIKADFINYFKRRGDGTYTGKGWTKEKQRTLSTVARERNIIQVAFRKAIEENYFGVCHSLVNPVSMHRRRRGLLEGEQEKIETLGFDALPGLNRYYISLAFYLAIDTGMRQQEIINLTWDDINFEKRRIKIRKSKTDRKLIDKGLSPGRTIVLPITAAYYLLVMRNSIHTYRRLPAPELLAVPPIADPLEDQSGRIFINSEGRPLRPKAVSKAWAVVVRRAGPELYNGENLRLHDLRRAANDRFTRANLEPKEQDIMLGHANNSMNDTYKSDDALDYILTNIHRRLDRYILGEDLEGAYSTAVEEGMTLEKYAFVKGGNPFLPGQHQKGGFKQAEVRRAITVAINRFNGTRGSLWSSSDCLTTEQI